jgi:hypothetical protein
MSDSLNLIWLVPGQMPSQRIRCPDQPISRRRQLECRRVQEPGCSQRSVLLAEVNASSCKGGISSSHERTVGFQHIVQRVGNETYHQDKRTK